MCYMPGISETQPHKKTIPYEVPCIPEEVVGADIFSIKNYTLLCIVDYYSRFPVIKKADSLTADDLVKAAMIVFIELDFQRNSLQM